MIPLTDDQLQKMAKAVAREIERGSSTPSTREEWAELVKTDPAHFTRLLDAGEVPADAFAVKEGDDD